ncbi:LysR family transcriptional regulator [Paralcaligenes sp. KSB-10]|uniref:LysR family transcriptional regulator n=1 Tax=Paralcaligenes sp. KSB-10 TaxID=2901142 RepID=UPI001E587413|nr:LysR family transcriptional regulator [Paralcaligenes sp. KSB-10]UHL66078.1 LysR family transcriptional regulator [Paralcaligenes sp. KSB-10]
MMPPLTSIVSRLHVKHLRLLIAVHEHGSLLSAAKEVAITQPGASKALQEIEAAFGATLFTRTNRGLAANDLGRCVVRYARMIYTDLGHLRNELEAIQRGDGGRVSVGSIMGAIPLLTDAVSNLMQTHPGMSVEIVEDTSATLLSLLDSGRLDLAICRKTVSKTPDLYESEILQPEELRIIANNESPFAHKDCLTLQDLAQCKWIVYRANMPMRLLLEREFYDRDIRFPANLLETTSPFATLALLRRNPSFVALASTDVASFFARNALVSILPFEFSIRSEPYELVHRQGSPMSIGAKLMKGYLLNTQGQKVD